MAIFKCLHWFKIHLIGFRAIYYLKLELLWIETTEAVNQWKSLFLMRFLCAACFATRLNLLFNTRYERLIGPIILSWRINLKFYCQYWYKHFLPFGNFVWVFHSNFWDDFVRPKVSRKSIPSKREEAKQT